VRILLRADSAFAREGLMAWCERSRVDYVFGLARNDRLVTANRSRDDRSRRGLPGHRPAGTALQGVPVVDARQLEPPAA
jgi:hypothetical protein